MLVDAQYSNNLNDSTLSTASSTTCPKTYMQTICVIDKRLNLVTLWNLDTFEYKLSALREIYARYMEEGSLSSSLGSNSTENIFVTDAADEWQTLDAFLKHEETFSPRMYALTLFQIDRTSLKYNIFPLHS